MRAITIAAAAAALLVAGPAPAADKKDWQACDGYPAPSKKADGITTGSWLFGLASSDAEYRRHQTAIGAAGLAACERVLSDPLLAAYWLRRAHLLQAKALHLLADNKDEPALAALKASDEAAAPHRDPLFADSVGLGNRALRALALHRLKRGDEARAELAAIETKRPWSNTLRSLSRSISLLYDNDLDSYFDALTRAAPHDPNILDSLFRLSILYGRLDQARPLYNQISLDLPRGKRSWQITGVAEHKYEKISERADLAGAMVYLLTAAGKADEAAALLAEAREDIRDATEPPVPNDRGDILKPAREDYQKRLAAGQKGMKLLDAWQEAVGLRRLATEKSWTELLPELDARLPKETPVMIDLLLASRDDSDPAKPTAKAAAAQLSAMLDSGRRKSLALKYSDLARMLPRPETLRQRPRYKKAGDGIITDDANGLSIKREKDSEAVSISYGSTLASPAMVEELGMLAAATKAREAGKDSFLIESRMMIQRTTNNYYYSTMVSSVPSGHEVRMRILPVSSAAIPAGLEPARWRLIDANKVYADLYPKYAPPPSPDR